MKYLKVKKGTKQWDMFHSYWNQEKDWMDNKLAIEQLIECPMVDNLVMDNQQLILAKPPEHLRSQFSKNPKHGNYYAKKNSVINRMWVDFAKLKGLTYFDLLTLALKCGLYRTKAKTFYPEIYGEYYVSWDAEAVSNEILEWCEEIDEPTFLRLYADWKEENEKQKEVV